MGLASVASRTRPQVGRVSDSLCSSHTGPDRSLHRSIRSCSRSRQSSSCHQHICRTLRRRRSLRPTRRRPWHCCGRSPAVRQSTSTVGSGEAQWSPVVFHVAYTSVTGARCGIQETCFCSLIHPHTLAARPCQPTQAGTLTTQTPPTQNPLVQSRAPSAQAFPSGHLPQLDVPPQSMSDSSASLALLWHESCSSDGHYSHWNARRGSNFIRRL